MNMHLLIVTGLAMAAAGGGVQVFISPYLAGGVKAEKRQAALRSPKRGAEYQADAASRRKQIAESLKEVEARGKRKRQSACCFRVLRRTAVSLQFMGTSKNSPFQPPRKSD